MKKILITGASGHLGREVMTRLLGKTEASNLAVMVRDASKVEDLKAKGVEIRIGDYNDYPSLVKAFRGIDKMYFISASDVEKRTIQQENIVKAAKEAGVPHVIYTSFQRKNETATSPIAMVAEAHIKTEKWLKEAGMKYTILKHNIYADMLPMFLGDKVLETGIAYFPAGDAKVAFTTRSDMAEVATVILTTEGHENKIYDVTNDTTVNFNEIAFYISQFTGKPIKYVSPAREEYIQTLSKAGVPKVYADMYAGFAEAFRQQEFDQTNHFIETLTGKKPVSVAQFLMEVYAAK